MVASTCYKDNKTASLQIHSDMDKRKITVEVRSYGLPCGVIKEIFPAEQFGMAIDLYHCLCEMVNDKSVASAYAS